MGVNCPGSQLSPGVNCRGSQLSWESIVMGINCRGSQLSWELIVVEPVNLYTVDWFIFAWLNFHGFFFF